jgi:hypothetical protein
MQSKNQLLRNFQEILNNNIEIIYTLLLLSWYKSWEGFLLFYLKQSYPLMVTKDESKNV